MCYQQIAVSGKTLQYLNKECLLLLLQAFVSTDFFCELLVQSHTSLTYKKLTAFFCHFTFFKHYKAKQKKVFTVAYEGQDRGGGGEVVKKLSI